jgi:hypothetical protein
MMMPFPISPALGITLQTRWIDQFESSESRDRTIEEGIWRRTQGPANADESAWFTPQDARRRIVHYHSKFRMLELEGAACLAVSSLYLYQSLSLPLSELAEFHERLVAALRAGGWRQGTGGVWTRGALGCTLQRHVVHPEDSLAGRQLPDGYESLDATVRSDGCEIPQGRHRLPWEVLARGIRRRDVRGAPTVLESLAPLAQCIPFQVELGCGISTEAGIPPLHFLHDQYTVTNRATNTFIFGGTADAFLPDFLANPESQSRAQGRMMHACLVAEPTLAHRILQELSSRRMLLTPIIANNFDGLPERVGLEECYIRRYDEAIPDVPIHPGTKALLVIGSHADRRKVQARFRERGLPIFFLDPEGFEDRGRFMPYLIEGAREGDFVRRAGATAGLLELARELGLHDIR